MEYLIWLYIYLKKETFIWSVYGSFMPTLMFWKITRCVILKLREVNRGSTNCGSSRPLNATYRELNVFSI